jgi:hypothetical protein
MEGLGNFLESEARAPGTTAARHARLRVTTETFRVVLVFIMLSSFLLFIALVMEPASLPFRT